MFGNVILLCFTILAVIIGIVLFFLIWNKPVLVIYIQLIYCCFMRVLISHLHFPEVIKFASDFFAIILFLQIILQFKKAKTLNIRKPFFFIILFFIIVVISLVINRSSIIFFALGFRVYFRLFVFFMACTIFLRREDIDKLMKFLLTILPVNSLVVFVQFFLMGFRDDYVGGLFGTQKGCNIESNLFLTIVTIITLIYYVNKKISLFHCVASILQISIIASLSELKILYFSIAIILFLIFFLTFPNARIIIISFFCFFVLIFGLIVLMVVYPHWDNMLTNFGAFVKETAGGSYGAADTLGRTTAGPYILRNILMEPVHKIFGIGPGYGDRYLAMESSFFSRYKVLAYFYFAYTIILIETGLIGLAIYCLFFLSIIYESLRIAKKLKNNVNYYCHISLIGAFFVFPLILYDQSMFYDAAFIMFFLLSFPFIMEKDAYENTKSSIHFPLNKPLVIAFTTRV